MAKKAASRKKSRSKKAKRPAKARKSRRARRRSVPFSLGLERGLESASGWLGVGVAAVAAVVILIRWIHPTMPRHLAAHPNVVETAKSEANGPLDEVFSIAKPMPVGERVAYWSSILSDQDDLKAKLTEMPGAPSIQDNSPLVPLHFDCTTFVETVAALARSNSPRDFFSRLLEIRYRNSHPTYFSRNHFPEADWLPNNVKAGTLKDITQLVGYAAGVATRTERKEVNRLAWLRWNEKKGRIPASLAANPDPSWIAPVTASVNYLPVEAIGKFAASLPNGSIINIVRRNNPRQPVIITHQGFVVRKNGLTYIRHANPTGAIETVQLARYLKELHGISWPIIGINVNQVMAAD